MCMSLYRIQLILEKIVFHFLGANFLAPNSSQQLEKQHVFGKVDQYPTWQHHINDHFLELNRANAHGYSLKLNQANALLFKITKFVPILNPIYFVALLFKLKIIKPIVLSFYTKKALTIENFQI